MSDKLAAAFAASEGVPGEITLRMRQLGPVTIASTGRSGVLVVGLPADATDGEIAELIAWGLMAALNTIRAERAKTAGGRILVPAGMAQ